MTNPKVKISHPMPCPHCKRIISADERYCPYCRTDTNAVLGPWVRRVQVLAFAALLLVIIVAYGMTHQAPGLYYVGWGGMVVSFVITWWLRQSRR